jgi:hypothetical protein
MDRVESLALRQMDCFDGLQLIDQPMTRFAPTALRLKRAGRFWWRISALRGGLFRLHADGACEPVLMSMNGETLPPCNFPLVDSQGRIWLTVSTRIVPRANDYRPNANTGFILLIDKGTARIVADGLGYTNECALSADEQTLFVNETFARRLTSFAIEADGSLSNRRTVAQFGPGTFPDGIVLDADGSFWVTSIVSNRVIRVDRTGAQTTILEESDPTHLADVEAAFGSGTMARPHLDGSPARKLRNISSLAFGGPSLSQAYLGCLLGESIAVFTTPTRGVASISYKSPLGALTGQVTI